jgi:maltooligosyltrehalose trehalohydrolase
MTPEGNGYFTYQQSQVEEGLPYVFKLADDGREYPDPASRWQPNGVHRSSAVFFPESYLWSDTTWRGVARDELVIYELHVGTFTPEGTFDAIIPRLAELFSLGVTAIELMPVAQFAGNRNWGYDAVYPYAVQNSYGGPRALQRFVDAAHRVGLAVILDVVYNHLGPEGNYLGNYGPYFTDRYRTPWGTAINYDGPESDAVRQFVVDNARMWVRDFHMDGLRLDAIQTIYDLGPRHILTEIQAAVQWEAARTHRLVHVVAESNQNDVRLICPQERGGFGLDGVWNDDFHHSIHALLTGERDGYYSDFGEPAHVAKAINNVFVYDGCYSPFRRRRHGSRVGATDRTRFVVGVQNHDQVGNRAYGDRLGTIVDSASQRLACGLLLLSPFVPLLFMGEEYGEQRPFPFFCSFEDPIVVEGVRSGRREEFAVLNFRWGSDIPDPQDPKTFESAKLGWAWPEGSTQARLRQLYQDLLTARRRWPALRDRQHTNAQLLNDSKSKDRDGQPSLLLLQRGGDDGLLAVANLTTQNLSIAALKLEDRRVLLSTEDVRYGGCRLQDHSLEYILPHELLVYNGTGLQP